MGYVYVGLCALRNWRNVDSQSSLGHFSFVIHQQLFGKVLGAKITFFIFNNAIKLLNYLVLFHCTLLPTIIIHTHKRQRLYGQLNKNNISLFSKLGTHFVPISSNFL